MEIKFFIGPMSKNIVDSIIEFQSESKNKIGLIPSRRQVDFNGGYANKWTTKGLSDYAKDLLIFCSDRSENQSLTCSILIVPLQIKFHMLSTLLFNSLQ